MIMVANNNIQAASFREAAETWYPGISTKEGGMLTKRFSIQILIILLMLLVAPGCSQGANPDWVSGVGLYSDPDYTKPAEAYSWLDPFYLEVVLADAPEDAVVRVSWIAADTTRLNPDTVIKIEEQTAASRVLNFELKNEGNFWPVGDYQVNVYLNGKLYQELDFEVYNTDIGG